MQFRHVLGAAAIAGSTLASAAGAQTPHTPPPAPNPNPAPAADASTLVAVSVTRATAPPENGNLVRNGGGPLPWHTEGAVDELGAVQTMKKCITQENE